MEDILIAFIDAIFDISTIDAKNLKFKNDDLAMIKPIMSYLSLAGIGMTIIYFLAELNEKMLLDGRDVNLKTFMAPFLKLFVAIALMSNGPQLLGLTLGLNNNFVETISSNTYYTEMTEGGVDEDGETTDSAQEKMETMIKDMGFIAQLGMFVPLFIMYAVSLVLCLVWWYKSILYKIEFLFRVGITPIAFADVYTGSNSTIAKYMKSFLALIIYGVSLIVLPRLAMSLAVTDTFSSDNIWDAIKSVIEMMFIAPFAALSCASLARTAAKEALGV